jgi:hypothetical protein
MWALIFIFYYDAAPYVEEVSKHADMVECFYAREKLSEDIGRGNGYFNGGQQALCVNLGDEKV